MNQKSLSDAIVDMARGCTRPFVTWWFAVTWVIFLFWLYANGYTIADMPGFYNWLTGGCVAWWFGEKTWFKLKNTGTEK